MMGMISRKQAGFAVLGLMTAFFLFFLTGYVHCKKVNCQPPAGHNAFIFPLKAAMPYWAYTIRRRL